MDAELERDLGNEPIGPFGQWRKNLQRPIGKALAELAEEVRNELPDAWDFRGNEIAMARDADDERHEPSG
jgi:hypothetical protein